MSPTRHKAQPAEPALEQRLDEALEETFPASDPIAVDAGAQPAARPKAKAGGASKERAHGARPRHSS
ncbi:MAG TPA: hypothetical protein VNE00_08510 [Paraburkholderia sp.]|jgi:hypothetical protein|nr:hypothetical protein [Paraburkholderia sp.]